LYDDCIKAPAGRHKKSHKFFDPIHKKFNNAKNGKYFQPFERIELIEPFEQQNQRGKLNR
jgi:hypothetical protein